MSEENSMMTSDNFPCRRKRKKWIIILCLLIIGITVSLIGFSIKNKKAKTAKVRTETTSVLDSSYKETKADKKKIAALQKAFPKISNGMDTQSLQKAVGLDYDGKTKVTAQNTDCIQYSWSAGNGRYRLTVLTCDDKVVGKSNTALFAPKNAMKIADLEALGDNPKREDVEKKIGKGVLILSTAIPNQDSSRLVMYGGSKGSWLVIYVNDVVQSVQSVTSESDQAGVLYKLKMTKKIDVIE